MREQRTLALAQRAHGSGGPLEDPHRTGRRDLAEFSGRQSAAVNVKWRLATVGGIREHVVDDQRPGSGFARASDNCQFCFILEMSQYRREESFGINRRAEIPHVDGENIVKIIEDIEAAPFNRKLAFVAFFSFGSIMLATRLDKVGEAAVLRETSTVFAALIGWLVLKETVGPRRIALMALIALGAVIVEMGG